MHPCGLYDWFVFAGDLSRDIVKFSVVLRHQKEMLLHHSPDLFQGRDYKRSPHNKILIIAILCQGAIFLYYAGRIKQVQGNLDEVSICPKHS